MKFMMIINNLRRIVHVLIFILASGYLNGQAPGWSINPASYQYNGSITAVVYLGPALVTSGTLGAFFGEECRGVVGGTPDGGRAIFYLMCYSDTIVAETLHFKYYDPLGNRVYDINETVSFTPNLVLGSYSNPNPFHITLNSAPVVENIPGQTVAEGESFTTVDLNGYVSDAESPDEDIVWTYSGEGSLTVSITGGVATIGIPNNDWWNGSATITFTATDPGSLSDSDDATFTVTAVNDPPSFTKGGDQSVQEDAGAQTAENWATNLNDGDPELEQTFSFTLTNDNNSLFSGQPAISPTGTLSFTPAANASGVATVSVTLNDSGGASGSPQTFTIAVQAVNDAPVVSDIGNQTINEGGTFSTINLDDFVSDVDNTDAEIIWTWSGNTSLLVSITNRVATISVPDADWSGAETINFRAENIDGQHSSDGAVFTVTAVNDAPVVSGIPDQSILEGSLFAQINLDDYVADADNTKAQLVWTASGNSQLNVTIDNRVATIVIPNTDWNGSETITFRATDPGPAFDEDAAVFTVTAVNDPPSFNSGGNQIVSEDAGLQTVNGWATSINAGPANESAQILTFNVTNNNNGLFSVQPAINSSGNLTYTPAANVNGTATVTVSLSDNGGTADGGDDSSDNQTFTITITAVNDPPSFTKGGDQAVSEDSGAQTVNNWATNINDGDPELPQVLTFNVSNNNSTLFSVQPAVSSTGTLTYTPAPDAFGIATVTVTLSDDGDGSNQSSPQTFIITITAINDPPVVGDIPGQTVTEGSAFATINLDNYVTDVDNTPASMVWSYSGNTELTVSVNSRIATITAPSAEWSGSETITFRATDTGSLWDEDAATFTVSADNDPPIVGDIQDQTIAEGSTFTAINLDNYVSDTDNSDAEIIWTYSGNAPLNVSIVNRVATITTPSLDWNGTVTITFTATDPGLLANSDAATFTVTPVNDPPSFTKGGNQTVQEDSGPQTVVGWATAISDGDPEANQTLTFNVTNNNNALFSAQPVISSGGTLTYAPASNANGLATVTVVLEDDGGGTYQSAPETFTISVTAVNDPPSFTKGNNQNVPEDSGAQSVNNWATNINDGDPEVSQTLTFNVTNDNTALFTVQPAISSAGTLTYTPAANAFGIATVTVTLSDNGGGTNQSSPETFTITIAPVNDAPVVIDIPGQTISEGGTFTPINLDGYVADADHADDEINWSYSGNTQLTVAIVNRIAAITAPSSDWSGSETITFRATDPGNLWSEDAAAFIVTVVNDAPVVSDIPNQTIAEGASFTNINLDGYVSDVDNTDAQLNWSFSGNTNLSVSITNRVATISVPNSDWNGTETITFRATDPGLLWDDDAAIFTVTGVNDAPVVTDIPDQTINEGSTFATISLDDYVSDVDNTDAQMIWTSAGNTQLTVSIINRVATISIPNVNWSGSETITFTASDGSLSDSDPATFTVTAVNDAPVVADIPNQTIAEGSAFATIPLDNYVTDIDNSDTQINWTYAGNTQLTVSIVIEGSNNHNTEFRLERG